MQARYQSLRARGKSAIDGRGVEIAHRAAARPDQAPAASSADSSACSSSLASAGLCTLATSV